MSENLLSRLPYRQRNALRAHRLAGLSFAEIARLLRCTPSQAARLVRQGERALDQINQECVMDQDEAHRCANALCAECPVRICPQLHLSGDYQHYRLADGRVRCFARDAALPDGATPSEAQKRLWSHLERQENDGS